jgi:hypothetical protein
MHARLTVLTVALAALALGGTACGMPQAGDGVASAASAKPNATITRLPTPAHGDRQKWLQCLTDHGVEIVDGKPDFGRDKARQERAGQGMAACEQYDPDYGKVPESRVPVEEVEQWRQWARCMREQGIDMSDPDPNAPDGHPFPRSTTDTPEQAAKAEEHCRSLAPGQ